jgi:hypothetical protein
MTAFRENIAEKLVRSRFIGRNAINIITIFNPERKTDRFDTRIGLRMIANLVSLTTIVGRQNSEVRDRNCALAPCHYATKRVPPVIASRAWLTRSVPRKRYPN